MDRITDIVPSVNIDPSQWSMPTGIKLADPSYYVPQQIDILLDASVFWEVLKSNQIKLSNSTVMLQETKLGYLVVGSVLLSTNFIQPRTCHLNVTSLNADLERFWSVEQVSQHVVKLDSDPSELNYVKNTIRDDDGKFCVSLPLRDNATQLGMSYNSAKRRFHILESKLDKDPVLKKQYCDFMSEYESLGHMELITDWKPKQVHEVYYIPHMAVINTNKPKPKLRVVFDASSTTSSGLSLNDVIHVGPVVQNSLFHILLRFRKFPIALTGDIAHMYRQILVNDSHCDLQRIL